MSARWRCRIRASTCWPSSRNRPKIVPTRLTFVDIAGLVRGASKGEGLGNQFLANIREVDAIAHVVRCFEDDDVTHVEGAIDPVADIETVETELMLADLDSLERRVDGPRQEGQGQRQGRRRPRRSIWSIARSRCCARASRRAWSSASPRRRKAFRMLGLLTSKPVLYVCNVEEAAAATGNEFSRKVEARAKEEGAGLRRHLGQDRGRDRRAAARASATNISAAIGLKEPGLDRLIRAGYALLDLVTYFTAGPKEARAWTVTRGTRAPQAAGVIHTDFERGFIRAETIAYDDYVVGGEAGARDAGKLRLEGKDYVVADGDVMHFRFATARPPGRRPGPDQTHTIAMTRTRYCPLDPKLNGTHHTFRRAEDDHPCRRRAGWR